MLALHVKSHSLQVRNVVGNVLIGMCIYISVWICKNMATEISLIYPLTEFCNGACFFVCLFVFFFFFFFYLFNQYRIGHSR